ncbi:hypothetical protein PQ455_08345 [Sphingomonas naphthae]|uniref:Uncharacterized protein n=1 Tax=Sphingomonas naphthae TaxID=1813468 RepID=A0ABY7TPR3_9SPHN|nr:hypothetical protein [Sphingomonas naphthae]WCT75215.1 hypothetical protein PQ455_08345 [Sphingomonas naphthae]
MTDRAPWEKEPPPPTPVQQAEARAERAETRAEKLADKAEAAAIRRRWITLGEVLAVLAVAISGLTLWNSWSERTHSEAEKSAADAKASAKSMRLVLKAELAKDKASLTLAPADMTQTIQSQTIFFPTKLDVSPVETTGDARIEAGWFASAAKKGDPPHDRNLKVPIAITTRFVNGDGALGQLSALYHLGYRVEGRLFGSSVELTGLSLIGSVVEKDAQKRIDALTK